MFPRTACLLALVFSTTVAAQPADKPKAKKEAGPPIDPNPLIRYEYGQYGRFGVSAYPSRKFGDIKKLTYAENGATNTAVISVDGHVAEFGGPAGRWVSVTTWQKGFSGQKLMTQGTWTCSPNIYVIQALDIVPNPQPVEVSPGKFKRVLDTCLIAWLIENRDTRSRKVGFRLELDTLIGKNDGVPFTVPGLPGLIDSKHDFPTADKVPDFLQAIEVPDLQNPETVAHLNLKVGRGMEAPSRVSLTRWTKGFTGWDVEVRDMGNDSSVILYWDPQEMKPKSRRFIGFTYGLGTIKAQEGKLGLTASGNFEKGGSFSVVATAPEAAAGLKLTLKLPPELELVDGNETQVVAVTKGTALVTWRVQGKKAGYHRLEVRGSNGTTAVHQVTISEPLPLLNPIQGKRP